MKTTTYIFLISLLILTTLNTLGQKDSSTKAVEAFTVPEVNAEYPGGLKQMTKYLKENVTDKIIGTTTEEHLGKTIAKFIIDENGKVTNAAILKSSTDAKIDKLFLDAIKNMPTWKPAENPKGEKTKQEFHIPLNICLK